MRRALLAMAVAFGIVECVAIIGLAAAPRTTAAQGVAGFSTGRRIDARTGDAIYRTVCQGCHMPDGQGAVGAGAYPALAGNPRLTSARYVAVTVLVGRRNMPAFADGLDDAQVAEVVREVRARFGDGSGESLDAADVAALRAAR